LITKAWYAARITGNGVRILNIGGGGRSVKKLLVGRIVPRRIHGGEPLHLS
jgi:hypothetical protein